MDLAGKRAALEEAVAKRGLSQDPLWFELQLDELDARGGPIASAVRGLQQVRDTLRDGGVIVNALQHGLPKNPEWMKPPRPRVRTTRWRTPWLDVQLNIGVDSWLDRVRAEAPLRFGNSAMIPVWFGIDTTGPRDERVLVHIGSELVGVLSADQAELYKGILESAARRERVPWVEGRLTPVARRRPRYLLEIPTPEVPSDR